jgi:hypothetical protein
VADLWWEGAGFDVLLENKYDNLYN